MRSSPQFGFTLAMYEVLQNVLPMPGQTDEGVHSPGIGGLTGESRDLLRGSEGEGPLAYMRSRNALKIILDLDGGFGLGAKADGVGRREGWRSLPRIMGGGGGQ